LIELRLYIPLETISETFFPATVLTRLNLTQEKQTIREQNGKNT